MSKNNWAKLALVVACCSGIAFALPELPDAGVSSAPQQGFVELSSPSQVSTDMAYTRTSGRSMIVRATAYNSFAGQTDSTPNITATGTRTRPGVVALSRNLLGAFPYGSRIQIQDLTGRYNFGNQVFIVEDTMAARKVNRIDIWMGSYRQAIAFGSRSVRITAVR